MPARRPFLTVEFDEQSVAIPEPMSFILIGLGLVGLLKQRLNK